MFAHYFLLTRFLDGTQKAVEAAQQEPTEAQVFAFHAAPADAEKAIEHAQSLIESKTAARAGR